MLNHPDHMPKLINEVGAACKKLGFFQVINHGIPCWVIKDALDSPEEFFNLPSDKKMCFASTDVREPVRYGTSFVEG
ncbi:hypothetical protein L2E82_41150 [Cichorium intybus]|uniref:Uncharacterized protein n=1 Tax=Cichorium intybus TaxID=13427 RepID=A0ACB9AN13_CICIN|nr:hypothetical protein L2E82_41150 [Cichorium intybus]